MIFLLSYLGLGACARLLAGVHIVFQPACPSRKGGIQLADFSADNAGDLAGTFLGTWVAAQLSTRFLKGFFIAFLYYVAFQMLMNAKPKSTRQLPAKAGMFGIGSLIGGVSSLVGIGGGSMSVPFMVWCNVSMHNAIGTSAAIGLPIALAGAIGYMVNGLAAAQGICQQ